MLTLILAAAVSQVYRDDFYMMRAQEDFVIDSLDRPVGWVKYLPPEIDEQVKLWESDCWRCRKRANEAVVAMGADAVRQLFWLVRAKNQQVAMHAEAVLLCIAKCGKCGGTGRCPGYQPLSPESSLCKNCRHTALFHDEVDSNKCVYCHGDGYLEEPYKW